MLIILLLIPIGGKNGKSVVNELQGVLSAKNLMYHANLDTDAAMTSNASYGCVSAANLDTDAAMTSNASYGCISAEKGTIEVEGLYESLFDDESQYVISDIYL